MIVYWKSHAINIQYYLQIWHGLLCVFVRSYKWNQLACENNKTTKVWGNAIHFNSVDRFLLNYWSVKYTVCKRKSALILIFINKVLFLDIIYIYLYEIKSFYLECCYFITFKDFKMHFLFDIEIQYMMLMRNNTIAVWSLIYFKCLIWCKNIINSELFRSWNWFF